MSILYNLLDTIIRKLNSSVKTETQSFTEEQKAQVRENIGIKDGVSPTIAISAITGGHRLTITDKNGTKIVDVMDGGDGEDGIDGKDGTNGKDGRGIKSVARTSGNGAAGTTDTYTITYTDNTTSTFTIYNGKNGTNGTNGKDGTSVVVSSVSESAADGGSNVVMFSDGKTLTVKNGSKGKSGKDGTSVTHSWNGTELTITSASGTSSADLKGEKGDKGDIPATFLPFMTNPKTIFPETFLTLNDEHGYNTHRCNIADKIELVAGKEYTVVWNGTSYKCVAVGYADRSYVRLGNDLIDYIEERFPFTIISNTEFMENASNSSIYDYEGNVTATVAIYSEKEEAYAINPKYIPDMYYTEEGKMVEILPETSYESNLDGMAELPYFDLVKGNTYTVICNGTSYECKAYGATVGGTNVIALGNGGIATGELAGEPFVIVSAIEEYKTAFLAFESSVYAGTIAIYHYTEPIHHVPPKYIKDMYYEEIVQGEILPTSTAIDTGSPIMGELYVVGDPITLIVGGSYKVNYNGAKYDCVATTGTLLGETAIILGDAAVLETGMPSGAYPFVLATSNQITEAGASIAIIALNGASSVSVSIYGDILETHLVPDRFLPKTPVVHFDDYGFVVNYTLAYTQEFTNEALEKTLSELAATNDKIEIHVKDEGRSNPGTPIKLTFLKSHVSDWRREPEYEFTCFVYSRRTTLSWQAGTGKVGITFKS